MFQIDVEKLEWMNGSKDDPEDLCVHGDTIVFIGDEIFQYYATVSATVLYLLKSISEDHRIGEEEQMLPCCGFSIYAQNNALDTVDIVGCSNGIDWSVIHEKDRIRLITSAGKETVVSISEYRKIVYQFADKVEEFYKSCSPKILPEDKTDREGYIAFWNEWHRRRGR